MQIMVEHMYSVFCPLPPQNGAGDMEMLGSSPRYVVSALRFLFVDQLISNLQTSIILGISSLSSKLGKIREWRPFLRCLPKHIKISKCYNFNENWYLEDFRPEECDRDKCNLKMVAILAGIFNMVAKTHNFFSKCSIYKENWYLGFFRGMWSWPMRFENGSNFGSHF
jgi:hypothetical protein